MKPARSIRSRLMLLLLTTLGLLWGGTAAWSFFDARHEMDELFDAQLAQSARLLLSQVSHSLHSDGGTGAESLEAVLHHPYEQKLHCQVWTSDRQLLYRASPHTPDAPLSPVAVGFSDRDIDGARWRVFAVWDAEQRVQVQLGQMYEVREELARRIASRILYPMLAALPLSALLIWFGVGVGIAPLTWVVREVSRRTPQNLVPLEAAHTPREIRPVVEALNALLLRLERALTLERQFTADAAHELRTPLAGLRTQAQVAARARDDLERQHALTQVLGGVDRLTRLVEQLLTLARLDPEAKLEPNGLVDLRTLAETVLAGIAPTALAKQQDLSLTEGPPVLVPGRAELLELLLRNLVDNAIRYTPGRGTVQIEVSEEGHRAVLRVRDSGPGIPENERARAFDRFYRVPGTGERGSGLGLAIVRRIARLHSAEVLLEAGISGHGLVAVVTFPVEGVPPGGSAAGPGF